MASYEPANDSNLDSDPGPTSRPYWMVGLALFGLIGVLIGGAFLLDRQFRPPIGTEPVAGDRAPMVTPPAVAAIVPTAESTATPTNTPDPTVTPNTVPTTVPTHVPTVAEKAALEQEVRDAYLKYWQVLIEAYQDLDTSRLSEVMGDPELSRTRQQVNELKEQHKAAKLDVEHNILIVRLSPQRATIYDEYINKSVFLDANTKQPLPTKVPPGLEKVSFHLEKSESGWRVIDALEQD